MSPCNSTKCYSEALEIDPCSLSLKHLNSKVATGCIPESFLHSYAYLWNKVKVCSWVEIYFDTHLDKEQLKLYTTGIN